MASRLRESQKVELLEGYRAGKSSAILAQEFGCSANTVNRIVKGMMAKDEYLALKKGRARISSNNPSKLTENNNDDNGQFKNVLKTTSEELHPKISSRDIGLSSGDPESINNKLDIENIEDSTLALDDAQDFIQESSDEDFPLENVQDIPNNTDSNIFNEVVPLIEDFGFENNQQKVSLKALTPDVLPGSVFMLVSQKVEIESKPIKDFPEWSFLPSDEQDRQAISIYENQRTAKRNCLRGQKVIKIPDSKVFILTTSFLLDKGITRIIFDDLLIALDELSN